MSVVHRTPSTFTNAEFERLVRSGGFGRTRVELRRGFIIKMKAQYVPHAHAKRLLAEAIESGLQHAALDWRTLQGVSVDFVGNFSPLPDIVVWDPAAAPADLDGPVPARAVRLIVEVADSTLSDDLGEKLEDYATGGLTEYWVADVKGRQILQHSGPGNATYARRDPVRFGEVLTSRAYPQLRVDTSALA
ncbi:MAG: Uma2 family endonuclease [Micropepsaceae bacterium]